MSESTGGSTTEILALGLDPSGLQRGSDQARQTLAGLKQAAADAARALDAMAGPADATSNNFNKLKQNADQSRQGMDGIRTAADLMRTSFDRARETAAAFAVSWAALRLGDMVRDVTNLAARVETLGVVLNRVAQNTTQSALQVNQFAVGVERMGITTQAARNAIIQMIQSHIDLNNAQRLARAAQDAAVVGNINSSEAFSRLIEGVQEMNTEILRNLGLNVSFQAAYEQMAASLNKNVQALTQQEQMQARVNAVLQSAAGISGSYEAAMDTAGKQLQSLARYSETAAVNVGNVFLPAYASIIRQTTTALQSFNSTLEGARLDPNSTINMVSRGLKDIADNVPLIVESLSIGFGVTVAAAAAKAAVELGSLRAVMTALSGAVAFNPWVAGFVAVSAAIGGLLYVQGQAKRDADSMTNALKAQQDAMRGVSAASEELTQRERQRAELNAREGIRTQEQTLKGYQETIDRARGRLAQPSFSTVQATGIGARLGGGGDPNAPVQGSDPIALQMLRIAQAQQQFRDAGQTDEAYGKFRDRLLEIDRAVGTGNESWNRATASIRENMRTVDDGRKAYDNLSESIKRASDELRQPGIGSFDLGGMTQQVNNTLGQLGLSINPFSGVANTQEMSRNAGIADTMQGYRQSLQDRLQDLNVFQEQLIGAGQGGTARFTQSMQEAQGVARELSNLMTNWPEIIKRAGEVTRDSFTKELDQARQNATLAGVTNPLLRNQLQAQQQTQNLARQPGWQAFVRQQLGLANTDQVSPEQDRQVQQSFSRSLAAPGAISYNVQQTQTTQEAQVQAQWAFRIAAAQGDGAAAVQQAQHAMEAMLEAMRPGANSTLR